MSSLLLSDYGLIGNQASAALVSRLGSIDWCCFPLLDAPSHFAAILDDNRGGRFQLMPQGDFHSEQRYVSRTHVLETVFETPYGRATLTDWMPMEEPLRREPVIFRRLEMIEGKIAWLLDCSPRFGYGGHAATAEPHRGGILFRGSELDELAQIHAEGAPLEIASGGASAVAEFELEEGRLASFTWTWGRGSGRPSAPTPAATIDWWRAWAHRCPAEGCPFSGPWHDAVTRSALVLKLLISAHSGSIAEAVTTSLAGMAGTSRCWDYRYAWIRDGAIAIQALAHLGYRDESSEFFLWLSDLIARDGAEGLQPVYRLDGGRNLPEQELPFLAGYQGSRPVRLGNHSSRQFQLDLYGHIFLAATEYHRIFGELPPGLWPRLREIADTVCQAWRRPDHGPWETRAKPEHYVASKALCWAALDRAVALAWKLGDETPPRWKEERAILHHTVCQQGFDSGVGAFTRAFGSRELVASALMLPMIGFLPFDDPRIESTLHALQDKLSEGIVMHRHAASTEGVPGMDATHLMTSFLYVSCLALAGRVDEASDRLAELCTYATPLGLFGEQLRLDTGETTGNFPSAAVHLGLINAALYVGAARAKARDSTAGASRASGLRLLGMTAMPNVLTGQKSAKRGG
jgi:GH15 family glucan-1,4-alpha-glucosidase